MSDRASPASVWLVDDSALQREVGRRALAVRHDVQAFDSVAPMLERLAAGVRPDILVLDWHMPEISGLDACGYIRAIADEAALPILVLTATGHREDLLAALAAGANDFVQKPCDDTELNARVSSLVRTKRLHAALVAAEAEQREEASFRERFLAILAHDLRQPLNVFELGADTLAAEQTPQATRNNVRVKFGRAAGRMQRMIGELLDFSRSRPQGGGMPVTPRAMDLVLVVRDVIDELRLAHPGREITLDVDACCEGTWDADRLAQVVSNLTENALAHSDASTPVKVTVTGTPERVELRVENRGEAIPSDQAGKLFDPFRSGASRAPSSRGLGLGLYIVDQIAKAHGGRVAVHSEGGVTRFDVMIPRSA